MLPTKRYAHLAVTQYKHIMSLIPSTHWQGLIHNTSIHAGIRAPLIRRKGDARNDIRCGFTIVTARDLDLYGTAGVISKIKDRVGESIVYISVDIDVLDPAFAPGGYSQILQCFIMSQGRHDPISLMTDLRRLEQQLGQQSQGAGPLANS